MNLEDAESAIAQILRDLERDTDCIVDSLQFEDIEVTRLDDDRRQFRRRVRIQLTRLPGHGWDP